MIHLKKPEEILLMIEGGKRLQETVRELLPVIQAGMTTNDIDKEAEKLIKKNGGEPSFKRVPRYTWSTCLPINEQVVHTPPSKRILKKEDVLTVDIGIYYRGFHTDYATTFVVGGKSNEETQRFLQTGKETLAKAIKKVQNNRYLGEISQCIEEELLKNKFFALKALTGHGVGKELHEDPFVPGYLDKKVEKTYKMRTGLALAIEVIYSMGTEEIAHEKGKEWSIISKDKSLTACFEDTVAITDKGTIVLTS